MHRHAAVLFERETLSLILIALLLLVRQQQSGRRHAARRPSLVVTRAAANAPSCGRKYQANEPFVRRFQAGIRRKI